MPKVPANGIEIYYEELGDTDGPPLLLVNGLSSQLVAWPELFLDLLGKRGFRLIVFDNRDTGLSSHLDKAGLPDMISMLIRQTGTAPPYTIEDMADDTAGLLESIGVESAHVFGISMGGMIAQALTIRHPDRVLSLCSAMSRTGEPGVGMPTNEGMRVLLQPPARTRDLAIAQTLAARRTIGSPAFGFDEEAERARIVAAYDRSDDPAGASRQMAAIMAESDRTAGLGEVTVPTLVIHGLADLLILPDGGEATARAIPGAELLLIEDLGHNLPDPLMTRIVDAIEANAAKAGKE